MLVPNAFLQVILLSNCLLLHLAISDTLRCVLPLQPARLEVLQKLGVELLLRGLAVQILRVVLHIVHTSEILTRRL